MGKSRSVLALAGLAIFAASCYVFGQEDIPRYEGPYKTDRSTSTRHVFSPHLGDSLVILPGIGWGALEAPEGEAEKFMLPFMSAFPQVFKGKNVLDIGTGNGIYALYAARLGAAKVVATDISEVAIENARLNAERLDFASIIETRLVSPEDTSAYSVIKPGEVFDVIITNAASQLAELSAPDAKHDPILGLSILSGLPRHLKADGAVIFLYRSKFLHDMIVNYARYLKYDVEHHEAVNITKEWCSLYDAHSAEIARREKLPAQALKYPGNCRGDARMLFTKPRPEFPPLWGKKFGQDFPGLILIRNKR